jgi:tripartite-type tricarboxylate transporter receptor subunit TctC
VVADDQGGQHQGGLRRSFVGRISRRRNPPTLLSAETEEADYAALIRPTSFINQVRAGTIRAYAITDDKRLASAPEIPTADEAGLKGFNMTLWSGLWVPKGTPKEIVTKLNAAAVEALNDPAVKKQLESQGLEMTRADQLTPEALGARQKAEIAKWWPMIKAANIKVD